MKFFLSLLLVFGGFSATAKTCDKMLDEALEMNESGRTSLEQVETETSIDLGKELEEMSRDLAHQFVQQSCIEAFQKIPPKCRKGPKWKEIVDQCPTS